MLVPEETSARFDMEEEEEEEEEEEDSCMDRQDTRQYSSPYAQHAHAQHSMHTHPPSD